MRLFSAFGICLVILLTVFSVWGVMSYSNPVNRAVAATNQTYNNRLAGSFSPYLRQHAHNPVDWYPWGEEAFETARREGKPILLSIGYSTCYWCHVLERETFMQSDVAKLMNDNIISIKIDREVRPDIDEAYMYATQAMTGSGGWPNNILLTPDLKPFHAVTYLPKEQWMAMINDVDKAWKNQRQQIEAQANQMNKAMQRHFFGGASMKASLPAIRMADRIVTGKALSYDNRYGGFGAGTKFPQEAGLLFLLDYAAINDSVKNKEKAFNMVRGTVDHMLSGGIHDHVGGGFHRYSTDQRWLLPHFEKMLYNQGLMAVVLARMYEVTGDDKYKQAIEHLLSYVSRQMTDDNGAFYSALDAETDAVEGDYYVWNRQDLESLLGTQDRDFLLDYYDLAALQHYPGHKYPDGEVLYHRDNTPDQVDQSRLDNILKTMMTERSKRDLPRRDNKILVAWNGMMIYGYAEAGRILGNSSYVDIAEKAGRFLIDNMRRDDGRLYRVYMEGQPYQNAFLDDYAWLGRGLMALYRATGNEKYKNETIALILVVDNYFLDKISGGYYFTDGRSRLPVRARQGNDAGALPSANPVLAHVFADLYAATGDVVWKEKTEGVASAFARGIIAHPDIYSHMIHSLLRVGGDEGAWPEQDAFTDIDEMPPLLQEESRSKVVASAHIFSHNDSALTKKAVKIILDIEDGWHVNANPASLDFLIPTVVDIQTEQKSVLRVRYPDGKKMETPLGLIEVYEGNIEITATVEAEESIDVTKMHVLIQVQACKEAICYQPSQIVIAISD